VTRSEIFSEEADGTPANVIFFKPIIALAGEGPTEEKTLAFIL